jgi:DNA-binding NarL/FixJ family response regulator
MIDAAEKTEGKQAVRVLLVDDHDLFRHGLRNLLEEQGLEIVGEAADGAQAVRMTRSSRRTWS